MEPLIQWYPGHIAKLERELQPLLKSVDVIIEVRDARIPLTSTYTQLSQQIRQQRPVLLVLNKNDLADPNWTKIWVATLAEWYPAVLPFDSSKGNGKARIIEALVQLGEVAMQKQLAKGLKRRPIKTAVVGMPNVGKSSLINALIGQKKARTGHKAGVTRTTQWIRIHPEVELMDTPGLIPPKLESQEAGQLLASVYAVGDAAFDEEAVVPYFLAQVESLYPGVLAKALDLPENTPLTLEAIAERRLHLVKGGELNLKRTAQSILKDYRHGKLGRLTLEHPAT